MSLLLNYYSKFEFDSRVVLFILVYFHDSYFVIDLHIGRVPREHVRFLNSE